MSEKIGFRYFNSLFDCKGAFELQGNGFIFKSSKGSEYIDYTQVGGITRMFYYRGRALPGSQASPNQYRIELKGGRGIILCVALKEEDAYQKKLDKFQRKIYGGNRLGVGLAGNIKNDPAETMKKDKAFQEARPAPSFSLETALQTLLPNLGCEMIDQTLL
jgi:hypothetical protein